MITWETSRYGEGYTVRLSAILVVEVFREIQPRDNPSPTPYAASVFGARLAKRWASADEAKAAAIGFAGRQLKNALDALAENHDAP